MWKRSENIDKESEDVHKCEGRGEEPDEDNQGWKERGHTWKSQQEKTVVEEYFKLKVTKDIRGRKTEIKGEQRQTVI